MTVAEYLDAAYHMTARTAPARDRSPRTGGHRERRAATAARAVALLARLSLIRPHDPGRVANAA